MTLQDLRRYAIRNRVRVRFHVEPAGDCLVDEHGLLKIPALRGAANFDVGALLDSVDQFVLDPVQDAAKPKKLSKTELQALLGEPPKAEQSHEE
jgi:hypothetical protein